MKEFGKQHFFDGANAAVLFGKLRIRALVSGEDGQVAGLFDGEGEVAIGHEGGDALHALGGGTAFNGIAVKTGECFGETLQKAAADLGVFDSADFLPKGDGKVGEVGGGIWRRPLSVRE